jgi:hypothetical protein
MQSEATSSGRVPLLTEAAIAALALAALAFGVWNARGHIPAVEVQETLPTQAFPTRRLAGVPDFAVDSLSYGIAGKPVKADATHAYAVPRGQAIFIGGWAVDAQKRRAAAGVAFEVDGKVRTVARYGGSRPDVAVTLHDPAYENSSYSVTIAPQALPPGTHRVSIDVASADRSGFYRVDDVATIVVGR